MAPAGSQQLRTQDPAPARRCGTEGSTRHQGREVGNGDGNRIGGGDGREDEYGDEHEGTDGGDNGSGNRRENRDDNRGEGGGKRELGNLRIGNMDGSEDARRRAKPTSNQQPQPQDPTPQRDRRTMPRTRAQGQEAGGRFGEDGGEAKERKKSHESCNNRRHVRNGRDYDY